jgi:uncharacterized membrane protein HdeD (DUF308 family)
VRSTAITVTYVVTGAFMVAWIFWGLREYQRTGRPQWLWMAVLLGVSLLFTITQVNLVDGSR